MTAMRLVSLARKEDIAITVNQIFKNPILSDMALKAREEYPEELTKLPPFALLESFDIGQLMREAVSRCHIRQEQIEDIYFARAEQGEWLSSNVDPAPGKLVESQAQIVFCLPESLDLGRFRAAWHMIIRAAPILRTRIINASYGIFQVVVNEPGKISNARCLEDYVRKDRASIGLVTGFIGSVSLRRAPMSAILSLLLPMPVTMLGCLTDCPSKFVLHTCTDILIGVS